MAVEEVPVYDALACVCRTCVSGTVQMTKLTVADEFLIPEMKHQVRGFLGLAYYCWFIPD